jgi:hypothetical protein
MVVDVGISASMKLVSTSTPIDEDAITFIEPSPSPSLTSASFREAVDPLPLPFADPDPVLNLSGQYPLKYLSDSSVERSSVDRRVWSGGRLCYEGYQ